MRTFELRGSLQIAKPYANWQSQRPPAAAVKVFRCRSEPRYVALAMPDTCSSLWYIRGKFQCSAGRIAQHTCITRLSSSYNCCKSSLEVCVSSVWSPSDGFQMMRSIGHLCLLKVLIWSKVSGAPSNVRFREVLATLHLQPSHAAGEMLQLAEGALKGLTRNRSCAELLYRSAILSLKSRVQGST